MTMHELGVVFYVVKDVKQVAEENQVESVASVTLQIGEVTGIIPEYLVDCWNWARKRSLRWRRQSLSLNR